MFGINGSEFVIIALVALFIFGPDRLPGAAKSAARLLRDVRRWTTRARAELNDTLGPEFENFDLADLNPKRFVQKHLLEGLDDLDLDLDGEKEAERRRSAAAGQSGATAASAVEPQPTPDGSGPTLHPGAGGSTVRIDTLAVTDAAVEAAGSGEAGATDDAAPVRRHPHVDFDAT